MGKPLEVCILFEKTGVLNKIAIFFLWWDEKTPYICSEKRGVK